MDTPPFHRARKARDLSQVQVAKASGASQRSVSDLDQGYVPRSVILAARVGRVVGLSLDEMFPQAAELPLPPRGEDEPEGPVVVREGFDQSTEVA